MSGPLGDKKTPAPAPAPPEWFPVPGKPHLEQNAKGHWRTANHPAPTPPKGNP